MERRFGKLRRALPRAVAIAVMGALAVPIVVDVPAEATVVAEHLSAVPQVASPIEPLAHVPDVDDANHVAAPKPPKRVPGADDVINSEAVFDEDFFATSDNPEASIVVEPATVEPQLDPQQVTVGAEGSPGLISAVALASRLEVLEAQRGPDAPPIPRAGLGSVNLSGEAPRLESGSAINATPIEGMSTAMPGLAFALDLRHADPTEEAGWARFDLDISSFRDAFGGDYGSRLRLYALPECVLTTPERESCQTAVPLLAERPDGDTISAVLPVDSGAVRSLAAGPAAHGKTRVRTLRSGALLADVAASRGLSMFDGGGGSIIAAVSGASGASGNFAATDLTSSGAWSVGQQTGTFTYSIPLDVPPANAGPVPDIALTYNSSAIDGRNASTNGQASWVGEGWDLGFGYIERLYTDCRIDQPGVSSVAGDSCWRSPYDASNTTVGGEPLSGGQFSSAAYVLNLGSSTHELRPLGNDRFVAADDPSIRVTRFAPDDAALIAAKGVGEYFKVQLPNGDVAYFGYGASGTAPFSESTGSLLTRPVVGDDSYEPCSGTPFCTLGYRWMLDLRHDASGNALVVEYEQETNFAMVRGTTKSQYTRAALPSSVTYGYTWDGNASTVLASPKTKVTFDTVERCTDLAVHVPSRQQGVTCPPLTAANKAHYPDVPIDLLCSTTCSATTHRSATFFTTKRLSAVRTWVNTPDSGWIEVAEHRVLGTYPLPAEASGSTLWLDGVYSVYQGDNTTAADDVVTYAVSLDGTKFANRVDYTSAADKLEKRRVTKITNQFGGETHVAYQSTYDAGATSNHCPTGGKSDSAFSGVKSTIDSAPWDAPWDCYRVSLTSTAMGDSSTTYGYYHKYLVDSVTQKDPIAHTPDQVFTYSYIGDPAWAYDENVLYYFAAAPQGVVDYADFRGYGEVRVTTGSGATQTTTATQYFRGLDGAYRPSGAAAVTFAQWGSGASVHDEAALRGQVAATRTFPGVPNAAGDNFQAEGWTTWMAPVTTVDGPHHSDAGLTRVATATSSKVIFDPVDGTEEPAPLVSTVSTTYDDTYWWLPATQSSDADVASSGNETCSSSEYLARILDGSGTSHNVGDVSAWGGDLYLIAPSGGTSYWGACDSGIVTSSWEVGYDGDAPGDASNLTRGLPTVERTLLASENNGTWLESRADYDERGRIVEAQTPADLERSPQTHTTWDYATDGDFTTAEVTNAAGFTSKVWSDRAFGNTVKSVDPNGLFTHYRYDAEGKLVSAWSPVQNAVESDGDLSDTPDPSTVPTVSFLYDTAAPGLATRTRPVAAASAQLAPTLGASAPIPASGPGYARRSYVFYDGFGRPVQQQSVAPDGSGDRLVTATGYDDAGHAAVSYDPFVAAGAAQFSSGLVPASELADRDRTETAFDWAGRPTDVKVYNGADVLTHAQTVYYGLATTSIAPTHAKTTVTSDALGRTVRQEQVSTADAADSIMTTYAYEVLSATDAAQAGAPAGTGFSRVTVTDDAGDDTVFVSDLAGRKVQLVDPNAGTTTYAYNDAGKVDRIENDATGVTVLGYDDLGRMISRYVYGADGSLQPVSAPNGVSSSLTSSAGAMLELQSAASWTYDAAPVGGAVWKGALFEESNTASTPVGVFTSAKTMHYDALGRTTGVTTALPVSGLLGDMSGQTYRTSVSYDAFGQVETSTGDSIGGLDELVSTNSYDPLGRLTELDVQEGSAPVRSLVTGVGRDSLGRMTSRTYGNGVVRSYAWNEAWNAVEQIAAGFDDNGTSVQVQSDTYARDGYGRVTAIADAAVGMTQCFTYDGFNRLSAAWTQGNTCASAVPAVPDLGTEADLNYSAAYTYSHTGRIERVVDEWNRKTSTYAYEGASPAAATSVEAVTQPAAVPTFDPVGDDFASAGYAGGGGFAGDWAETADDGDPATGFTTVGDGLLHLSGSGVDFAKTGVERTVDAQGATGGTLSLDVYSGDNTLNSGDVLTVQVADAADPSRVVSTTVSGADALEKVTDSSSLPAPFHVTVDLASVVGASQLVVSLFIDEGDGENNTTSSGEVFLVDNVAVDLSAGGSSEPEVSSSAFAYDGAGRMTSRTVDGDVMALKWDPSSNLVATSTTADARVYVYDASGQRLAQIKVSDLTASGTPLAVSVYVGDVQVGDATPGVPGGVTSTRFVAFGSATVATVTVTDGGAPVWSLLLGDVQGSAQVSVPLHVDDAASGGFAAATQADADGVERAAYTPYGAKRGVGDLSIDRGWLGQVEDTGTGLTYLNARYYDPTLMRFLSPDPLLNPGDPRTLDAFRYAENDPVTYTDSTGLAACSGVSGAAEAACLAAYYRGTRQVAPTPGKSTTTGRSPRESIVRQFLATAGGDDEDFVPQARQDFGDDDTSPWSLGVEWLTGNGPRVHHFGPGSSMVDSLKNTKHYRNAYDWIIASADAGSLDVGLPRGGAYYQWDYGLSGAGGVVKYVKDYSTLLTGGRTGNLATTYLGSHDSAFVITDIQDDHIDATFLVWNASTIESGSRPPIIGYEDWWKDSVGDGINRVVGQDGPMSPTTQYLLWDVRIDR